MRLALCAISAVLLVNVGGVAAQGQSPRTVTMTGAMQQKYEEIKRNLRETAEKMPDADFAFRPTAEIRSFAELLGHIANTQFNNCSIAKGEPNPSATTDNEKKTTKAELLKALNDSFAYCDGAYAALTPETAAQLVKQGENQVMRGYALMNNVWHNTEIYGSAATYLRMKGLLTRAGADDLSRHR
jgi:uncharacterized damage-inducible protein DinB